MAYIYKYSERSIEAKNKEASQCLKEALHQNKGIYVKLGQLIGTLDVIVPLEFRK